MDIRPGAGDACRVVYDLRRTPQGMLQPFIDEFDSELRQAFQEVVGFSVSDTQWDQACLGIKFSGLGLCRAGDIAEAAYIASRSSAFDACCALDGKQMG